MTKFRTAVLGAIAAAALAVAAGNASAQQSFAAMLEDVNKQTQARLQLTAEERAEVEPIMKKGLADRIAVFKNLGLEPGQRPAFSKLLELQSQMNTIRTKEHKELAQYLSENQLYIIDKVAEEWRGRFRKALLGG